MSERRKARKLGPVEILVVVLVGLLMMAVITGRSRKSRIGVRRIECERNLSVIGNAMQIYANDYDGAFPRSGGRNSVWHMRIPDWRAADRFRAFGMAPNGDGGNGTISSCFYLLVKHAGVEPKSFVCPGEEGTTEFNLALAGARGKILADLWDFGPEPPSHCSYSYHMPFGLFSLTTSSDPKLALAADRNPWIDSSQPEKISLFMPVAGTEAARVGNSPSHHKEGQSVLFVDGHVSFEDYAYCGINEDNIYTYWDGGDIRRGAIPTLGSSPQDLRDSLLVNEPAIYRTEITKDVQCVDTNDLKQTAVVATLDCPVPRHKNVIWCAPFQIAWDKFKNDIIEEPIQLIGENELPERLNRSQYSPENIEAESLYATAGFVKDGILEKIQEEMARRFPSEPKPVFNELYRKLRLASIAYSFLRLDVGFRYPFYVNNHVLEFENSNGIRKGVSSFCSHAEFWDGNAKNVRDQVDILYYKHRLDQHPRTAEFAVDLCKYTNPYQVILSRVPQQSTLGETLAVTQKKVLEFKQHPDHEELSKLKPMDELIVPDILFNMIHHFKELELKLLANPKWRELGYFVFEAQQMVEFTLSRRGVSLKSEARVGGAAGLPRLLHFDRPFLIYVKKRGAEFSPFFVMWVDNAELMQEF